MGGAVAGKPNDKLIDELLDPERHKVVRWRLIDLRDEIARKFGMQCTSDQWASCWPG